MRDSDWSREILLRSDWLSPYVAICTTEDSQPTEDEFGRLHVKKVVMLAGEN